MAAPAKKPRNPYDTKRRILAAAKVEFAKKGLGGARVDDIAARAKANKRMMYHYFGNKEELFRQVVEDAYGEFRDREAALELDSLEPVAAVKTLIAFIWKYFLDNPEFITLVNSENLHKARHIKKSQRMQEMNRSFVRRMQHLLERGVKAQVFRKGLDPVQVNISIAAVGYYYLTNRFTGSIVFERDLMAEDALAARLEFNTRTILRMICTPQTLERIDA
ncbi:MAG TPA: TetR/AcrR family transcriptional regulator [Aestuariivirga sp.]|nr:TetR family transcriptional regulator [Hyphomicrobiales bacterium]HQY72259.1 TetR/AcrR family transcriptional regulator [Aestuariivirga sp.]HRA92557.1 TetR/AcrR family transcriptional regulator [Aestuariivirga sp.]